MATLRVVLDTNVLLSGLACPLSVPGRIIAAWRHGSVEVLLSARLLDELRRVLPKLAHRHGLSPAEIEDLVDALSIQAEVIEPVATDVPALRDADDRPVLGTLLAALRSSGADYPGHRGPGPAGAGFGVSGHHAGRVLVGAWRRRMMVQERTWARPLLRGNRVAPRCAPRHRGSCGGWRRLGMIFAVV